MATAIATPYDRLPAVAVPAPSGRPAPDRPLAPVIPLRPTPAPTPAAVYRRRRLVAAVLVLATVALAVVGLRSLLTGAPAVAAPAPALVPIVETVVLEPGDTLWELAVAHTPADGDPRVMLESIRQLNGFTGDAIPAWTTVAIPAG